MKLRLAGLTIAFVGLALAFAAFSWGASGRGLRAALAVLAGTVVFLLGRRLLHAAHARTVDAGGAGHRGGRADAAGRADAGGTADAG